MELFKILFLNLIFFIWKIKTILCSYSSRENFSKQKEELNTFNNKRLLSNSLCTIQNCLVCDKRNECIKCSEGYELDKRRCYSKNCEIFGFCKFCDEYDCLKCIKGYKLNYGICDEKVHSTQKIIIITVIPIIFIFLLIYLFYRYKKKTKERIKTGQILKFSHPKSGYYQLYYEIDNNNNNNNTENNNQETSQNKTLGSTTSETNGEKDTPIIKYCVVCHSKKTYSIADCGCSLCEQHFKNIKSEKEKLICRIHKIYLCCNMSFKMVAKSNIKGNALDKLGLPKCPICKIHDGTQSFNCGCPMRVCENCFNDNVYVFKYNQCPGCGSPYNPMKNTKKKEKSEI